MFPMMHLELGLPVRYSKIRYPRGDWDRAAWIQAALQTLGERLIVQEETAYATNNIVSLS